MSSDKRELASSFLPGDIEGPLYTKWIDAGYFTADANSSRLFNSDETYARF